MQPPALVDVPPPGFAVLMSLYAGERPAFLRESLASIRLSTRLPSEVVLVEDGPIGDELREVIEDFRASLPIRSVRLPMNLGLPAALNEGLHQTQYELVARFDTDDLCDAARFENQLSFMAQNADVAVLGTWVEEFDTETGAVLSVRSPPQSHSQIVDFAKRRSPLNHPSVMFRRSVVLQVGGYSKEVGFEDYSLWLRLILAGHKIANLPSVLVRMRAGRSLVKRRRGLSYARHELGFVCKFRKLGFFTWIDGLLYIVTHTPFRMLPLKALTALYQWQLRSSHPR